MPLELSKHRGQLPGRKTLERERKSKKLGKACLEKREKEKLILAKQADL